MEELQFEGSYQVLNGLATVQSHTAYARIQTSYARVTNVHEVADKKFGDPILAGSEGAVMIRTRAKSITNTRRGHEQAQIEGPM